ncbi:MAG: hypothetical protein WCG66_07405 [bacterium]
MISTERASAPLPWLAGAIILLYLVLLVLRFVLPPANIQVEVHSRPPASATGN